jgi:hypothetical protein
MTEAELKIPEGRRLAYKAVLDSPFLATPLPWPTLKSSAQIDDTAFQTALLGALANLLKPLGDHRRAIDAARPPKRRKGRKGKHFQAVLPSAPALSADLQAVQQCLPVGMNICTQLLQSECFDGAQIPLFDRKACRLRDHESIKDVAGKRRKLKVKRKRELVNRSDKSEALVKARLLAVVVCREDLTTPILANHFPGLCGTAAAKRQSAGVSEPLYLISLSASAATVLGEALGLPRVAALGVLPSATSIESFQPLIQLMENMQSVTPAISAETTFDHVRYLPTKIKYIQTTAPIITAKAKREAATAAMT